MVNRLNLENFEDEVMNYEGTVIVDFYADWCGPCQMQGPIFEEFSEEHADVKCVKLNIDDSAPIAIGLKVMSVPTIMVVKNGEITYKQPGLMQKYELEELV